MQNEEVKEGNWRRLSLEDDVVWKCLIEKIIERALQDVKGNTPTQKNDCMEEYGHAKDARRFIFGQYFELMCEMIDTHPSVYRCRIKELEKIGDKKRKKREITHRKRKKKIK